MGLPEALSARYRIERELGQGGMATVYLAEDLKHHRQVAIKVLRPELSASVGAARFLREIEIAAQLQHPNILPLLDSGEAAGLLYYVMPFVEGQSLRQRLAREPQLPVGEALRLLVEIVDALGYAHERGVVHRDIKPDNMMLSGRHALIADFGVARAVREAGGENTLTSMGMALGTPTYMAPEQATASPDVDHRADIYSVGVLGYEILAGRPPFQGGTPQQTLASHVTQRPEPLSRHRPGLAPALEHALMRCLEKLPADRWQSAGELLAELERLATPSGRTLPTSARLRTATSTRWTGLVLVGALLVAVGGYVVYQLLQFRPVEFGLGRSEAVTSDPGLEIQPAISPDGKFVAYAAGNSARMRIFIRATAGGRTIPLSNDTLSVESQPRWSPDGSQVLFLTRGGVSVGPAMGGSAQPVVPGGSTAVASADWSPSGREIVFVRNDSLLIAALDGSQSRLVGTGSELTACSWSPRERWIACVRGNHFYPQIGPNFGNAVPSEIALIPAAGGEWQPLTDARTMNQSPVWSPDGRRVFFVSNRDGPRDIYAQEVSGAGRPKGEPQRITAGLGVQTLSLAGDSKRIAYSVYQERSNLWSLPFPSQPPATAAGAVPVTTGNQTIASIALSRDGRWLVYSSDLRGNSDIYRIKAEGGEQERLTNEPFDEFSPDLSPDGRKVAYHAFRTPGLRQIEVKPLDGGPVERVTSDRVQWSNPIWSPDGKALAFFELMSPFRMAVARRIGPSQWSPPRILGYGGGIIRWSPDGRTILFTGLAAFGGTGLAIQTIPADSGPIRQVYAAGPEDEPPETSLWSPDGRTVYFKTHDRAGRASIWAVPASGGNPRLLVHFPDFDRPSFRANFNTDGRRIYVTVDDRQSDIVVAELIRK